MEKRFNDRVMAEYGDLNRKNYKNLFDFLDLNNLKITSNFGGTDMDCAYKITNKDYFRGDKVRQTDWYITFLYKAYDFTEFTWNLDECISLNMNEDLFLNKLNIIKNLWCKVWDGESDFKQLNTL